MKLISLSDVTYSYRHRAVAVDSVTADFGPGINLLMGPNGAGKTTLMRLMAGLLRPSSGSVTLEGVSMSNPSPSDMARLYYLPEDCSIPMRSIAEMTRIYAPFYPRFSAETLEANLSAFGIDAAQHLQALSFGTRKKAALAYALALGVDLLLLDEPTNGLDINGRHTLSHLIAANQRDDQAIIIATHQVSDLENLFDSVTVMDTSHVLLAAPTERITSALTFSLAPTRPADALWSEPSLKGVRCVGPNTQATDSAIDYDLLYMALTGAQSQTIINLINQHPRL